MTNIKAPQDDKAWFLEGVSKGRRLVLTVNRSWPITVIQEALLQTLKPRVAAQDLPSGVAGAVVTTVWGIPQGLGSLGYTSCVLG